MDSITQAITYAAIAGAVVCIVIGVAYAVLDVRLQLDARAAAKRGATLAKEKTESGFAEQADAGPSFEALAKLAAALKDLDKSNRYLVLALGFLGVAALSAGANDIASAIDGST
ncbi:MAG: hypothetical protein WD739_11880 [Actinomycetota bacterium]